MNIEYFWITDTELLVNGEKMTPETAYLKYPKNKEKIYKFVNTSHKLQDRVDALTDKPTLNTTSTDNNIQQIQSIINKITEIFNDLNIQTLDKYKSAYSLFNYIIENSKYDNKIMQEKQLKNDMLTSEIQDIYRCLIEKRSVCTSDASSLSLLFRKAGIASCHITIAEYGDDPKGVHEVVKFNIDNQDYICDPTLIRTALENNKIPQINPSIFAFTPTEFFKNIYPTKEVKFEHTPIII